MRARGMLVSALLLVGLLGPRAVAARSWTEVRSPSFTVITDGSDGDGRRVAAQFETIRAHLKAVWPWANVDPHQPVMILAVRNEAGLKQLLPGAWEKGGQFRPAGVFLFAPDRNWVALRMDVADRRIAEGDEHNPYLLVFHEYVHLVLRLNFSELPPWFNEGLAEFWGNTIIRERRIDEGRPIAYHLRVLRTGTPMTVAELLGLTPGSSWHSEENRATIFYAQSWALVHYLMMGSEERQGQLNRFAMLLRQGVPASRAASEAFGDLAVLDRELQSYIRRVIFRYGRREAGIDVDASSFAVRAVPEAEWLGFRALFHVASGRESEARALATEALQHDPGPATAHEALALLAWRAGDVETARDSFGRAVERPDASAFAHYQHGQLCRETWDGGGGLKDAEASFRRALELSPSFAAAYEALALVLAEQGATLGETLPLAVKAALLDPGEIRHSLTALDLAAGAGEFADAREQAERLLANTTDDDDRALVELFLRQLTDQENAASGPRWAQVGCEQGNAEACADLATRYRDGAEVEKDPAQAAAYFEKACSGGHASSCAALGWALEQGDGVSQDITRAVALYRQGCDGEDAWSCRRLAFALASGQGVAADPATAARLLEGLCADRDLEACARFGSMLRQGHGTPKDDLRAEEVLSDTCAKGSAWGCGELGFLYAARTTPANVRKAATLFERACDGGSAGSCAMLAALVQAGRGVERSPERARALYRQACDGGYADACGRIDAVK